MMPYSTQETFDLVAAALAKQGRASRDEVGCCYRGPDGLKCAAGHLIPDDQYTPSLERTRVDRWPVNKLLPHHSMDLLKELQQAHDSAAPGQGWLNEWAGYMRSIARRFGLSTSVLDTALAERAAEETT